MQERIGAIILAAGKGSRMQSDSVNKVAFKINGKPMIVRCVELLESLKLDSLVVVVGFAKESVKKALAGHTVLFAEQKKQLGTGHAVSVGLEKMRDVKNILVVNGDDAFFLTQEILNKLISVHLQKKAVVTLLTMEKKDSFGVGRVVRDAKGAVIKIVEEKDATEEEKMITEVSGIGYIFARVFLEKYLAMLKKSAVTQEYYLTGLIELASGNHELVESVFLGEIPWKGVNTREELDIAEMLFKTSSH